jgi:hypothetical protein
MTQTKRHRGHWPPQAGPTFRANGRMQRRTSRPRTTAIMRRIWSGRTTPHMQPNQYQAKQQASHHQVSTGRMQFLIAAHVLLLMMCTHHRRKVVGCRHGCVSCPNSLGLAAKKQVAQRRAVLQHVPGYTPPTSMVSLRCCYQSPHWQRDWRKYFSQRTTQAGPFVPWHSQGFGDQQ